MEFDNQLAVVTGAASGIGRATARNGELSAWVRLPARNRMRTPLPTASQAPCPSWVLKSLQQNATTL